jgi:multiple sugar transport system permease protein
VHDWRRRRALAGFLFVLPTWLAWVFWTAIPAAATVGVSLTRWNMVREPVFVGLQNYATVAGDAVFLTSLRNSLLYALAVVPTSVGLALAGAILIDGTTRLREYYRIVYFLPVVTSAAATSILWKWLYQPTHGPVNAGLGLVGIGGPNWLNDPRTALLAVGLMTVWQGVGFLIVLFLAGLQAIPTALYDAAALDGATGPQRVRYLTIPLLRPTALFVSVVSVAEALQVFVQILVMTGGGPAFASSVLAHYLYMTAFQRFEMGYAATIALAIFLLVLAATLVQLALFRQREVD